jgi:type 1 glutamine amidotransferase
MVTRALIIYGGWEGHQPGQCARLVASILERDGVDVELSDSLATLDHPEMLAHFSVIIPCWTMGDLTPERERHLTDAVRGGIGLAGWHGGMADAFRSATDYQFMVGGQFVAHPGGIIDYRVEITDRDHPITRGLGDFDVHTEQYYLHVDPSNHVLATTTFTGEHAPWIAGCRMPVAWTRRYGEGRVFCCSIGHVADDLRIPEVSALIRRGALWAARALDEDRTA